MKNLCHPATHTTGHGRRFIGLLAVVCISALCLACGTSDNGDDSSSSGGGSPGGASSGGNCNANSSGGNFGLQGKADMQISRNGQLVADKSTVKVNASGLQAGKGLDTKLLIVNAAAVDAAKELKIAKVLLIYSAPPGGKDSTKPAFECLVDQGGTIVPCDKMEHSSVVPSGAKDLCTTATRRTKLTVIIRFNKPLDDTTRNAVVRIISDGDDKYDGNKSWSAKITSKAGQPKLAVKSIVDFGTVKLGEKESKIIKFTNAGDADLKIHQIKLAPKDPKPYKLEVPVGGKNVELKGGETKTFDDLVIPPQKSIEAIAWYSAVDGNPHQDVIEIVANDQQKDHSIKLLGNQNVPCLQVVPDKAVNFGFVPLGHDGKRPVVLRSCGSDVVEVSDLKVVDDKDVVFGVDTKSIPTLGGKPVSKDNPIKLGVNEEVTVQVKCTPESAAKDVKPGTSQYMAKLGIVDNTVQPDKSLSLLCNGTATNCPTSVIVPQEGEEIVPQQELHLVGSQSFAGPNQEIAKYEWKVTKRPKGAEDHIFWPNPNAPDVVFGAKTTVKDIAGNQKTCNTNADCKKGQFCDKAQGGSTQNVCYTAAVNIAGEYGFKLTVHDKSGNKNCVDAKQTVLVIPNEAIHIELLWDTPGDKDKLDKGLDAGSDLDLHFAHQTASKAPICQTPPKMCSGKPCLCQQDLDKNKIADPWFHSPFDTYWFNPNPNWGSADPKIDDNPGLDLDDTDGWGPENMNLNNPENNNVYSVGVHYWDAHGFGDSVANVRIYILGKLVADMFSVTMKQCDMWWVKQIEWPSGLLLDYKDKAGKGLKNGKITPKYFTLFAANLGAKCSN